VVENMTEILAQLFPWFTLAITMAPVIALACYLRSLHVKVKWLVQVQQAMLAAPHEAPAEPPAATVTQLHLGGPRHRRTGR
jgi:hypothetical protein